MKDGIGSSCDKTAEFRELDAQELCGHPFSDYFRFSFTLRIDRDEALALARRIESLVSEERSSDCRVYLGIRNTMW